MDVAAMKGPTCACVRDHENLQKIDDDQCNKQCPGNTSQICGGERLSEIWSMWIYTEPGRHCNFHCKSH